MTKQKKKIRNKEVVDALICCNNPMELKAVYAQFYFWKCKICGGYLLK